MLFYGYVASLAILLLFDLMELSDNLLFGIICIGLHLSYCYVAQEFNNFRKDEYNFPSVEEDPNVEQRIMRMKLGGYFCCAAGIAAILFSWYLLFQGLITGGYIYLVFFRYKDQEDGDDNFN